MIMDRRVCVCIYVIMHMHNVCLCVFMYIMYVSWGKLQAPPVLMINLLFQCGVDFSPC